MKIHGGTDKTPRPLTLCGITVLAAQAPYSQPVQDITCGRCRRIIMGKWKAAIEERAQTSGYALRKGESS